jgi:peptide subunit release factor 1 (eRF1)
MVSCYADLSGTKGALSEWAEHFKAETDRIKRLLGDDANAWEECERSLGAIRPVVALAVEEGARGAAIFARGRQVVRGFPLPVPVENQIVVHATPYLVPLLQVLCRQREYLVILTNTHHGRLYEAGPGELRLLHDIEEDVPSRQRSAGWRWGKEQATIARHREDRILHYQKELVDRVEKVSAEHAFRGLILLGEHEVVEHVRKRLPARLASRVVRQAPQAWTEEPLAIRDHIQTLLAEVEQAHEAELLGGLEQMLRNGGGVVTGARAVVEALQGGRIGTHGHGYLVVGSDPREAVARCTACRSLSVGMPTRCPRCQSPCVDASLWEEILLFALRHEVAVHCVKADTLLRPHGGIAAVLPGTGADARP